MFSEYKLYIIAAVFLAWSVGVWHVAGEVKENAFNQERLQNAQAIIKIQNANDALAQTVTDALTKGLTQLADQSKQDKKALVDEIKSDPRYADCKLTDSVRDQYKRKLQAQR